MNFTHLNETDVREEIIAPLVRELGYRSSYKNNVLREQSLRYPQIQFGRKKPKKDPLLRGKADYILEVEGLVRWVIEAKAPSVTLDVSEVEQAWTYANHPEIRGVYFALCNGMTLMVYQTNLGPKAAPILSLKYEDLDNSDTKIRLSNLLSPEAILRDYPIRKVDARLPLGQGLRSIARITGGYIRYETASIQNKLLSELQISIANGAIERTHENKLVALLESRAPTRSMQEFLERLGNTSFEMTSSDKIISSDPNYPTKFTHQKTTIYPAGEALPNLMTGETIILSQNIHITTNALAEGALDGNIFKGSFISRLKIPSVTEIVLTGLFEIHLG